MGKVLSIASQKGGVGKTTTALNLGYCLSRLGSRVLILDCDPQGGLAVATNLRKKTTFGLIDVLKGELAEPREIIMQTRDRALSIAGMGQVDPDGSFLIEERAKDGGLAETLKGIADGYDYAILDTPAGIGGVSTSILSASDSAILVVTCRSLALKTLPGFLKLMQWVRDNRNPHIALEGVLINMRTRVGVENEVCAELKETLPAEIFFETEIPMDASFEDASLRAVPVGMLTGGEESARRYSELALELKEREYRRRLAESEEAGDGPDRGLF